MNLTANQQLAVDHRGSNLLLSASAGSGKTEVLARRVVSLLGDAARPISTDRLLVVTFTRAAAAELRARIGAMLRRAAAEASGPLRAHLRRSELLLDAADIGTIDAWCQRLVRRHFAIAGVDPDFRVLSPQEALLLEREALDALFDELADVGDPMHKSAADWLDRGARLDPPPLRLLVRQLHAVREHLVDADSWLAARREECGAALDSRRAASEALLRRALAEELSLQIEQWPALCCTLSDALRSVVEPYGASLRAWRESVMRGESLIAICGAIAEYKFPQKPRAKHAKLSQSDAELHDEMKDRWFAKRLKSRWGGEAIEPILRRVHDSAALLAAVLDIEARLEQRLRREKRRLRGYSFGDVQRLALGLLATRDESGALRPSSIAAEMAEGYDEILVDECQDTSPLQVALLRLITRTPPAASNRCMVGDVKQSIYGFRQAEPRLFAEQRDAMLAGSEPGRVLQLADNFRSHPRLLSGLNSLFANLFERSLGGTDFGEQERLRAGRDDTEAASGMARIEICVLARNAAGDAAEVSEATGDRDAIASEDNDESGDEDASPGPAAPPLELIEREGLLIAAEIRKLIDDHAMIADKRDGGVGSRPADYGDIVVLLRSAAGQAPLLAQALRAQGIPAAARGRDSLLDSREATDLRCILALLVNRSQDVPLAAYLRSPHGGLTPGDLQTIRGARERGSLLDATMYCSRGIDDTPLRTKVRAALDRLDHWLLVSRAVDLPELVRILVRDTMLALRAEALPQGDFRTAMLHAFSRLAADFAARGGDLAEFTAFLDALSEEDQMPDVSAATPENVVSIMTVHASKGLEFPFVFLAGAGAAFSRRARREPLLGSERIGLGLRFDDLQSCERIESPEYRLLCDDDRRRELEEELRLLYVATTRARERLWIIGHAAESLWPKILSRGGVAGTKPPLLARLAAGSTLEWCLLAAAASGRSDNGTFAGGAIRVRQQATGEVPFDGLARDASNLLAAEPAELPPLPDWLDAASAALSRPLEFRAARTPALLSISAVKSAVMHAGDDGAGTAHSVLARPELRVARFARGGAARVDGRVIGDALHRFMQFADLARLSSLADIRAQLAQQVADGRLEEDAAALVPVDDVIWFARQPLCTALASASRLHRETPFVCSLPCEGQGVLLRGVIDAVAESDDGLAIVDYKTDVRGDELAWQRRVDGYTMQLRCYALAAAKLFEQPVRSLTLIFICENSFLHIPPTLPTVDEILTVALRQ